MASRVTIGMARHGGGIAWRNSGGIMAYHGGIAGARRISISSSSSAKWHKRVAK